MNLCEITPVILSWNEAANIGRCLDALDWADHVVVLDSGSSDDTERIVARFPFASFRQRRFDDHATQWNAGISFARTAWVLSLDADYIVTDSLVDEIQALDSTDFDGFYVPFLYCIEGAVIGSSLYPPRIALFKRDFGRYEQDGHTQRLQLTGKVGSLKSAILHDDRKPYSRWLENQSRYAQLEADNLRTRRLSELRWASRIRRMYLGPLAVPLYASVRYGLLFRGRPGLRYLRQRFTAEVLIAKALFDGS